jgi:hypothetical protein
MLRWRRIKTVCCDDDDGLENVCCDDVLCCDDGLNNCLK